MKLSAGTHTHNLTAKSWLTVQAMECGGTQVIKSSRIEPKGLFAKFASTMEVHAALQ